MRFQDWCEEHLPQHTHGLGPMSRWDAMRELCRRTGFRQVLSTETITETAEEFKQWWLTKGVDIHTG